jgi:RiboL-PSP-HEPN
MQPAIEQFRENISHVKNLATARQTFAACATDLSDILRAEIVLAVSALDKFIHDLVRMGMLEILAERRPQTPAYLKKFQVNLETVIFTLSNPTKEELLDYFDEEIRTRHEWQSFQYPDKIADAIRLISEIDLWKEIAKQLGMIDVKTVKERLKMFVDRRNTIAHEADNIPMPTLPAGRWPIEPALADEVVEFIEKLAEAIYKVVV